MKTHLLRNMFIVGSAALALAASTVVLPSVADAAGAAGGAGVLPHGQSHGRVGGANFRSPGGRGGYGGGYGYGYGGGGYYGGYYPGYCGPIQLTLGLCGPWGY
jgi:hypothetical protein